MGEAAEAAALETVAGKAADPVEREAAGAVMGEVADPVGE